MYMMRGHIGWAFAFPENMQREAAQALQRKRGQESMEHISADRRYSPLIKYFCHTESRSLVAPFCFSCSLIFFKNTGRCLYLPVLKMKH